MPGNLNLFTQLGEFAGENCQGYGGTFVETVLLLWTIMPVITTVSLGILSVVWPQFRDALYFFAWSLGSLALWLIQLGLDYVFYAYWGSSPCGGVGWSSLETAQIFYLTTLIVLFPFEYVRVQLSSFHYFVIGQIPVWVVGTRHAFGFDTIQMVAWGGGLGVGWGYIVYFLTTTVLRRMGERFNKTWVGRRLCLVNDWAAPPTEMNPVRP